MRVITTYEYSSLLVGETCDPVEVSFRQRDFDAFRDYALRTKCRYYTVGYNEITFCNYVGVIQFGDLTIEVLPKADKLQSEDDYISWRIMLVTMLNVSGMLPLTTDTFTQLKSTNISLLFYFMLTFIRETTRVLMTGMRKQYRFEESNIKAYRGKLLIGQHIQRNHVNRDRFYTSHTIYDTNNIYNQILYCALLRIAAYPISETLKSELLRLFCILEGVEKRSFIESDFRHLSFWRETERYRDVISLARLILLNLNPDISSGSEKMLTILFDMNRLYERFIGNLLIRYPRKGFHVSLQESRDFYQDKTIRPDIVVIDEKSGKTIIMDTKWKIRGVNEIDDSDLKQMYVYNKYFGAQSAYLVFPALSAENIVVSSSQFHKDADFNYSNQTLECGSLYYRFVFDDNGQVCLEKSAEWLWDEIEKAVEK